MRLSGQFQACLFIFLRVWAKKNAHKQKSTNKTKLSEHLTTKATFFLQAKTSKRMKVVRFAFWCFFYAQNLLVKKNKQAWNCPDNLSILYYYPEHLYIFFNSQQHQANMLKNAFLNYPSDYVTFFKLFIRLCKNE